VVGHAVTAVCLVGTTIGHAPEANEHRLDKILVSQSRRLQCPQQANQLHPNHQQLPKAHPFKPSKQNLPPQLQPMRSANAISTNFSSSAENIIAQVTHQYHLKNIPTSKQTQQLQTNNKLNITTNALAATASKELLAWRNLLERPYH